MDNIESDNLIGNLKSIINEDNIKISNENKQILLEKIEEYINFVKSKSVTPEKIQSFENIKQDWLLFLPSLRFYYLFFLIFFCLFVLNYYLPRRNFDCDF